MKQADQQAVKNSEPRKSGTPLKPSEMRFMDLKPVAKEEVLNLIKEMNFEDTPEMRDSLAQEVSMAGL